MTLNSTSLFASWSQNAQILFASTLIICPYIDRLIWCCAMSQYIEEIHQGRLSFPFFLLPESPYLEDVYVYRFDSYLLKNTVIFEIQII